MDTHITTYSGLDFDPIHPEEQKIQLTDIAHALSRICRGNGHVKTFYSVAQHCLQAAAEAKAQGLSPLLQLAALLHDASECYLSDVPHPVKQVLPDYCCIEDRILESVYHRFLGRVLTPEEAHQVKAIDTALLHSDLYHLLHGAQVEDGDNALYLAVDYTVLPFEVVTQAYEKKAKELLANFTECP